jgi:hypothetical protein
MLFLINKKKDRVKKKKKKKAFKKWVWVWDPADKTYSRFWIADPGVKKSPDHGFQIPDLDPQQCLEGWVALSITMLYHAFLPDRQK